MKLERTCRKCMITKPVTEYVNGRAHYCHTCKAELKRLKILSKGDKASSHEEMIAWCQEWKRIHDIICPIQEMLEYGGSTSAKTAAATTMITKITDKKIKELAIKMSKEQLFKPITFDVKTRKKDVEYVHQTFKGRLYDHYVFSKDRADDVRDMWRLFVPLSQIIKKHDISRRYAAAIIMFDLWADEDFDLDENDIFTDQELEEMELEYA